MSSTVNKKDYYSSSPYFLFFTGFLALDDWMSSLCAAVWSAGVLVAMRIPFSGSRNLIMEHGLQVIASLCDGHAANQAQLGKFGACKGAWVGLAYQDGMDWG